MMKSFFFFEFEMRGFRRGWASARTDKIRRMLKLWDKIRFETHFVPSTFLKLTSSCGGVAVASMVENRENVHLLRRCTNTHSSVPLKKAK